MQILTKIWFRAFFYNSTTNILKEKTLFLYFVRRLLAYLLRDNVVQNKMF